MNATTPQSATPEEMTAPPYPAAITVSGPPWHSPLAHDGTVPLIHPRMTIGLLETNDIVLTDPSASRIHASVEWTPQGYLLRDLGSRTGTLLHGLPIFRPTLLAPGHQIRIGRTLIGFQAVQAEGATPVMAPPPIAQPAVAPVTTLPMQAIVDATQAAQVPVQKRWLARQRSRYYWRIFLVGLAIYVISWILLAGTDNLNLIPLVTLSAASLVPIAFVVYCWEQGAFADIPPVVLSLAFVSGGTMGVVMAATLEALLVGDESLGSMFIVAICEELAKAVALIWFLNRKSLRSELDGLVLGAATGMGFAALETAGYGISVLLKELMHALENGAGHAGAISAAVGAMGDVLTLRMALAMFGHGVWTAIIGAAIWRERRNRVLRITPGVLLAFAISVLLHTIWDSVALLGWIFDAVVGILILRFFLRESIERAKLAPDTPAPPLGPALARYFAGLFHRKPRVVAPPQAFISAGVSGGPLPAWPPAPAAPPATAAGAADAVPAVAAASAAATAPAPPPAEPPPAAAAADVCSNCGNSVPAGARFCGECGQAMRA